MPLSRNHFYRWTSLACVAGYGWLALVSRLKPEEVGSSYDVCLIHHFLHVPCPSCGSTRSVLSLLQGDLAGGLFWNPLGLVVFSFLIIAPLWIGYDLVTKKDSFFHFFNYFEGLFRLKWVAISAIVLLLMNWVWNFYKGV